MEGECEPALQTDIFQEHRSEGLIFPGQDNATRWQRVLTGIAVMTSTPISLCHEDFMNFFQNKIFNFRDENPPYLVVIWP